MNFNVFTMLTDDALQEKISVPPELNEILKDYVKAALREKPDDLLQWSAVYFRALANNETREKKEDLHIYSSFLCAGGLSEVFLRYLFMELQDHEVVTTEKLKKLWRDLQCDSRLLLELFSKAGISHEELTEVNWMKILALAAGVLSKDLRVTMRTFMRAVTGNVKDPRLLFSQVEDTFKFLAQVDDVPPSDVQNALEYLRETSEKQDGYVLAENFEDPLFPAM